MSVRTAADKYLDLVTEHISEAIRDLTAITLDNCRG